MAKRGKTGPLPTTSHTTREQRAMVVTWLEVPENFALIGSDNDKKELPF